MTSDMFRWATSTSIFALLLVLASIQPAYCQTHAKNFNVPAQPATSGIPEFARQAGIQILVSEPLVRGKRIATVIGTHSVEEALAILLQGTGLVATSKDGATFTVVAASTVTPTSGDPSMDKKEGKISSQDVRVAQVDPGATESSSGGRGKDKEAEKDKISEIVVTAEKRDESSLDVPMSLTALSGAQLERTQSYRYEDFVGKVPGLTLIQNGALGSELVIRGITTGVSAINAPVATYIDETPYMSEGPFAASNVGAPNLDAFDMQRIEVLRGPQGTLYGANALGGIFKYVTNAPDPAQFEARVEAGGSSVEHGGTGFDVHGMVNLPLASTAALRLVGYDNYYPGFIDDPSRGLTDIDGVRFKGGRASLLVGPTADFSIRLNALYQDRSWNDFDSEDVFPNTLQPVHGKLVAYNLSDQPGHNVTQLYNVTANWDMGVAKLVSSSSYYLYRLDDTYEQKDLDGYIASLLGGHDGLAVRIDQPNDTFTQEIRLSSPANTILQWQVGGYYTNQNAKEFESLYPIDGTTNTVLYDFASNLGSFVFPTRYREYAGFANVDYHIAPTFDVGVGGRYSYNDQTFHETGAGTFGGGADIGSTSSQGVFTYSADARWHVTPTNMLYLRVASGFVPGGPADVIATAPIPHSYSSSTTTNYEAGSKSALLDDHLTVEVSAFDIEWRKIQLASIVNGFSTITNGGSARSQGAEWSLAYVPIKGVTAGLNGAYTDAHLTQDTPATVNGRAGERLPSVPLWETSASLGYEHSVTQAFSAVVGAEWRFVGSRYADFSATGPRQQMPSYGILDLRAGIENQKWSFTLYAKNVGNKIGVNYLQPETLNGGLGAQSAVVTTPRTLGVTATAAF